MGSFNNMKKNYFNENFQEVLFATDISLIHSYDARALNTFFQKVAAKKFILKFKNNDTSEVFENIHHIDGSFLIDQNKSLFDLPLLKAIDFERLLIQYADPNHVLDSESYQDVKRNMSKFLSSMLNLKDFEDTKEELKFDYHLEIKNVFETEEVQANPLLKKLNFLRLLIKLNDFNLFKKPQLFLLENFDLISSSQHQLEFFQLLNKVKKIKNITLMMDVVQNDTFSGLSHDHLFDSFLMYPDFNNEWKFEHFLTNKNWNHFQEEFAFLFQIDNNKTAKLKNNIFLTYVLKATNFNFFSSKESVLCFSRKVFSTLLLENDKFNLYKLDKISDLIPIIAIMNSLKQTFKLKVIFEKEELEHLKQTPFIGLLNKYKIKWTMIDSNKPIASKSLKEVLTSFIEERQPKLKLDLEPTQTNSIKVIEFIANDNEKEITIENPMIPISSVATPNDKANKELEINLEAIISQQMERLSVQEVKAIYNLNNSGLLYPVVTERLSMFFSSIPLNKTQSETIEEGIFKILKEITKISVVNPKKSSKNKKTTKPSNSNSNHHKRTKRWKH